MVYQESLLKKLYNSALELLFPEKGICFICDVYDENIKKDHICEDCRDKLHFIGKNRCPTCGKPLEIINDTNKCSFCIKNNFYFKRAFSPLEFTGELKDAIYKFKYQSKPYMYKSFGELMVRELLKEKIEPIDIIVPIPLHRSRMAKRGYNQSELVAKYISKKLNIPLDRKNLIRTKATKEQNTLSRLERQKNIKNAFSVRDDRVFMNKRVLLVDDIFTTGATVNEGAKVLKSVKAKEVIVITIATVKY